MPKTLRWGSRYAYHQLVLGSYPKVLSNSFQKAGTHLLLGALSGVPGLRHYERAVYWYKHARASTPSARGKEVASPRAVGDRLATCLPGEIYRGHIAHHSEISDRIRSDGFRHIFIYRDPRDTIISLLHWWKLYPRPRSWPYRYFNSLPSDQDRLTFFIEGWPEDAEHRGFPANIDYPNIGARFAEFVPWLGDDHCLAVRFEDLVNEEKRLDTYARIATYLLPDAPNRLVTRAILGMTRSVDPSRSKTFRQGKSGEWRRHFSEKHVELFKHHGGPLLMILGYEVDADW